MLKQLEDLQYKFYKSIFRGRECDYLKSNFPNERINIYRNNIIQVLRSALEITYPAVWQLLGQERANYIAYKFLEDENSLPASACLDLWGADFVTFLQNVDECQKWPYLSDVANLEWLQHLSYYADDSKAIGIDALSTLSENEAEHLKISFASHGYLYHSQFAIDDIMALLVGGALKVDYNARPTYGLISRIAGEVSVRWIDKSIWEFLTLLWKEEKTMGEALEIMSNTNFDLPTALIMIFSSNIVVEVEVYKKPA
jgi:hypothetical protein